MRKSTSADWVHGVVKRGLLRAGTEVEPADVFVIAVSTLLQKGRKLGERTYRDVNIGFASDLSIVIDAMAQDVWVVTRPANRDRG